MTGNAVDSDKLFELQTEKVTFVIKSKKQNRILYAQNSSDMDSTVEVCAYQFLSAAVPHQRIRSDSRPETVFSCDFRVSPMFFSQTDYEILLRGENGAVLSFWNEYPEIRENVSPVFDDSPSLLSGIFSFGTHIGTTEFLISVDGQPHAAVRFAVFPLHAGDLPDFGHLLSSLSDELYGMFFDSLSDIYQYSLRGEKNDIIKQKLYLYILEKGLRFSENLQSRLSSASGNGFEESKSFIETANQEFSGFTEHHPDILSSDSRIVSSYSDVKSSLSALLDVITERKEVSPRTVGKNVSDVSYAADDIGVYSSFFLFRGSMNVGDILSCLSESDAAMLYETLCLSGLYRAVSKNDRQHFGTVPSFPENFTNDSDSSRTTLFLPYMESQDEVFGIHLPKAAFFRQSLSGFVDAAGWIRRFLSVSSQKPSAAKSVRTENSEKPAAAEKAISQDMPLKDEILSDVDWNVTDVMVASFRNEEQYNINFTEKFYYAPEKTVLKEKMPVQYIALYRKKSWTDPGIRYYGKVISIKTVRRKEIPVPFRPERGEELYYLFRIDEWKSLAHPILVKEDGVYGPGYTSLFLLTHCRYTYELFHIRSAADFKMYSAISRLNEEITAEDGGADIHSVLSVGNNRFICILADNLALCSASGQPLRQVPLSEFSRAPARCFRRLLAGINDDKIYG